MKLNQLYSESIRSLDPAIQEWLIREAPHFIPVIGAATPTSLAFLQRPGTVVDMGFEDLQAPAAKKLQFLRAFSAEGVVLPPYELRIRRLPTGFAAIEASTGSELVLPSTWRETVVVIDVGSNQIIWFGSYVRPDRLGDLEFDDFRSVLWGWERVRS